MLRNEQITNKKARIYGLNFNLEQVSGIYFCVLLNSNKIPTCPYLSRKDIFYIIILFYNIYFLLRKMLRKTPFYIFNKLLVFS